ncbi:MAG: hypothetical protein WC705_03595 [Candidatus Paceibacterota bacterium]|jgi:hypothetical protein
MAIYIQEEKEGGKSWLSFGVIFVILVILGIASYYLFFVKPDLISGIVIPVKLKSIDDLAKMNFNPQDIVSNQFFKISKQYISPPTPIPGGNISPFGVF